MLCCSQQIYCLRKILTCNQISLLESIFLLLIYLIFYKTQLHAYYILKKEKIFIRINEIKSINQTDIPILLKISPDENQETILNILKIYETLKINGLIVSNTSIDKGILEDCSHEGGISGKPLFEKSNQLLETIHEFDNEIFLIGVGGVFSKEDYESKIKSGASLVQIYTGFIFEGPAIVKNILSR